MADIVMPRLSESMDEGTIIRWLKEPGASIARADPLVEIEADKTTLTYESDAEGVLEIVAQEGDTLAIGALIARVAAAQPAEAEASSDKAPRLSAVAEAPAPAAVTSGDGGSAKGEVTITEPDRVQQLTARRVSESRATIPTFTLRATVDMTECVDLRASLQAGGEDVPSITALVVKACAIALAEHPSANGAYRDGKFERYTRVNVGVNVAADDALVVPTIFDADKKGLAQITTETRDMAQRVHEGTITPPELSGGTFTVSNLGMFGVRSFEAVINPPQAAILSVGALEARPVVRDGQVVVRQQIDVELACDHRILYGAQAAEFLTRIREFLEAPLRLVL